MNPTPPPDLLAARRRRLREAADTFGLEFAEVLGAVAGKTRVRIHLLGRRPRDLAALRPRLRRVGATADFPIALVTPDSTTPDDAFDFDVAPPGEGEFQFSLRPPGDFPVALDPFFESVRFRFVARPAAPADPRPAPPATPASRPPLEIDYLAKDYATFRQLLLDRLSVTMPDWKERHSADLGVMLVEVLAYAADHLSYQQDAVGTEAYLGTCRLRPSLRRHARLIDYRVHEGCNARAWMHLHAGRDATVYPRNLEFLAPRPAADESTRTEPYEVFAPVDSAPFPIRKAHNTIRLYDWHGAKPGLNAGATDATLVDWDDRAHARLGLKRSLRVGTVLLFEELRGPWTGAEADADPRHRHAIRLTHVRRVTDPLRRVGRFRRPLPLVDVRWDAADALPFSLWISTPPGGKPLDGDVPYSVARGNIVLADHGARREEKVPVRPSHPAPPAALAAEYPPAKPESALEATGLTFSEDLPRRPRSAAEMFVRDPRRAVPQLALRSENDRRTGLDRFTWLELRDPVLLADRVLRGLFADDLADALPAVRRALSRACPAAGAAPDPTLVDPTALRNAVKDDLLDVWLPKPDLLNSGPADAHVVVEMTDDRAARLRFGARGYGRPPTGDLVAEFRVGNGLAGNLPARAIREFRALGSVAGAIAAVTNPLPAVGGVDPEPADDVRRFAPHALRARLERAVAPRDYEAIARRHFGTVLQQVRATARWSGHEVHIRVALDPRGDETIDSKLLDDVTAVLHRYRRIGHDVRAVAARRVVPILRLNVCLTPRTLRLHVEEDLNELFSHRVRADGSFGLFHPDRFTFGDDLYVSQLVAAAVARPGVAHAEVTALHRSDRGPAGELAAGVLSLDPGEVVRFDNDPARPEYGRLCLHLEGGR